MASFLVTGNTPLHGSVRIGGAKNASYKLMIASLLADTESRLLNFSHISDVQAVKKIIEDLGGRVTESGERALFIQPSTLSEYVIDASQGAQGRFSTMFIGPLLARFGKAVVPSPGGDKIGRRPLDRHFDGLVQLGAKIEEREGMYIVSTDQLTGTDYTFEKNTHTGTETLLLAAVKAKGKTTLRNAAQEPEIDDLILFLNNMGAKIKRLDSDKRVIKIEGVSTLHGAIHKIMPDRNEAVSYACAAIATKGDVIIENARENDLTAFLSQLKKIGAGYEIAQYGIRFYYKGKLKACDITTGIEPGFMTDWQPLWATLATQCHGTSTIHETIMQDRFQYVEALTTMGAQIEKFRPKVSNPEETYNFDLKDDQIDAYHAIKITGPSSLKPGKFEVVDLRHGATIILAALIANGTSEITNIELVDRGYEQLDTRLKSMGANIQRLN